MPVNLGYITAHFNPKFNLALKTLKINIKVSLGKSEEENKKQKFYHVPFLLLFSSLTKKVGFPSSKR